MFLEQSTSAEGDLGGAGAPRANISENEGEASSGDEQEDGLEAAQHARVPRPAAARYLGTPPRDELFSACTQSQEIEILSSVSAGGRAFRRSIIAVNPRTGGPCNIDMK
ncbi:hypothetical protein AcW1_006304 [Taiwanofungus camphoratus]|nr:hypothetical protein AcW1_006304 [Antrodia cinnamomea]